MPAYATKKPAEKPAATADSNPAAPAQAADATGGNTLLGNPTPAGPVAREIQAG